MSTPQEPWTAVENLQRWESFGATWRVLTRDDDAVTLALCRCDGGEEVERISSRDADLLAYIGDRRSSES